MAETIVVTDAVVFSPDGTKVLLAKNVKNAHILTGWIIPGGKLERSESLEECLVREIFEETGVIVNIESHLATFVGSASMNEIVEEVYVIVGFIARASSETLSRSSELSEAAWFRLNEMPKDLYPDSKYQILLALERCGKSTA